MKAVSVGLESEIYVSSEEVETLKRKPLEGILKFYGVGPQDTKKREIPFILTLYKNQKEDLAIDSFPEDVYFGDSERIEFKINEDYYNSLIEFGEFVSRFNISAKLKIGIEGRYERF